MLIFLFLLVGSLLFVYGKYWRKSWQNQLWVGLDLSQKEVFQGENFQLTQTLKNQKFLPLPFLRVSLPLDWPFYLQHEKQGAQMIRDLHQVYTLKSYDEIQRKFTIKVNKRGIYSLEEVEIYGRDLLLGEEDKKIFPLNQEIIVYPPFLEEKVLTTSFEESLGESLTRFSLYEDPLLFRGVREYAAGDSLRQINWKKTAALNGFYVNQYEPVAKRQLTLILLLPEKFDWHLEKLLEGLLSLYVTVAKECLVQGYQLKILTNGVDKNGNPVFPKNVSALEVLLRGGAACSLYETPVSKNLLIEANQSIREKMILCSLQAILPEEEALISEIKTHNQVLWLKVVEKKSAVSLPPFEKEVLIP